MDEELKEAVRKASEYALVAFEVMREADILSAMCGAYREIFVGLVKEGFADDQAIKILCSMNIGK